MQKETIGLPEQLFVVVFWFFFLGLHCFLFCFLGGFCHTQKEIGKGFWEVGWLMGKRGQTKDFKKKKKKKSESLWLIVCRETTVYP